jgi:hypothetical protein
LKDGGSWTLCACNLGLLFFFLSDSITCGIGFFRYSFLAAGGLGARFWWLFLLLLAALALVVCRLLFFEGWCFSGQDFFFGFGIGHFLGSFWIRGIEGVFFPHRLEMQVFDTAEMELKPKSFCYCFYCFVSFPLLCSRP